LIALNASNANRHWTDPMIRVHAFHGVLAASPSRASAGIDVSQARLWRELKGIREITNYYPA
jgi:hypothetical protein